jgi:hypothetical protein
MFVSCEYCVLSCRGLLRRADHSSRGVVQTVMCLSMIMNPQQGGDLDPIKIQRDLVEF